MEVVDFFTYSTRDGAPSQDTQNVKINLIGFMVIYHPLLIEYPSLFVPQGEVPEEAEDGHRYGIWTDGGVRPDETVQVPGVHVQHR